jgi:Mn-dependent DtxR family transcriptional regulator
MTGDTIPADLRRFILTSIASIPYLEAMLLLRSESEQVWNSVSLAKRLYLGESNAAELLSKLQHAGVVALVADQPASYRYQPGSEMLGEMIDQLDSVYARHLVAVTQLIHSKADKHAQQFADAFKLRKDS